MQRTWSTLAPILAFSATVAEYCRGSNTGELSFSSRTVTVTVVEDDLGGSPRSFAVTSKVQFDLNSRSNEPDTRNSPSTGPTVKGSVVSSREYSTYPFRPSSLSTALMAITTVLLGAFSIIEILVGDMNSGDMSFTSNNTTVTYRSNNVDD